MILIHQIEQPKTSPSTEVAQSRSVTPAPWGSLPALTRTNKLNIISVHRLWAFISSKHHFHRQSWFNSIGIQIGQSYLFGHFFMCSAEVWSSRIPVWCGQSIPHRYLLFGSFFFDTDPSVVAWWCGHSIPHRYVVRRRFFLDSSGPSFTNSPAVRLGLSRLWDTSRTVVPFCNSRRGLSPTPDESLSSSGKLVIWAEM
jgi:hypothetical protein